MIHLNLAHRAHDVFGEEKVSNKGAMRSYTHGYKPWQIDRQKNKNCSQRFESLKPAEYIWRGNSSLGSQKVEEECSAHHEQHNRTFGEER